MEAYGRVCGEVDWCGRTPLLLAVQALGEGTGGCSCPSCKQLVRRRARTVQLLLRAGGEASHRRAWGGLTPAHVCAMGRDSTGQVLGLRLLRASRAPLWARDGAGLTPLAQARREAKIPSPFVRSLLLLSPRFPAD